MQPLPNPDDQKYKQVEQDKRGDGEIKAKIFPFDTDIAGKMAQPFQAGAPEINDNTRYQYDSADQYQVFTNLCIHAYQLLILAIWKLS